MSRHIIEHKIHYETFRARLHDEKILPHSRKIILIFSNDILPSVSFFLRSTFFSQKSKIKLNFSLKGREF